jgi:phage baseplate assembly protein W
VIAGLEQLGIGLAETFSTREAFISEQNDIATTADELENFANAIWRRIMTPLGFYPEFPDYGCEIHSLRGLGFVPETLSLAEIFVTQALVREVRVQKIVSISVYPTDYRALAFYVVLQPIDTPNPYVMTFDYFLEN